MTAEDQRPRPSSAISAAARKASEKRIPSFTKGSLFILVAFCTLVGVFSGWSNSAGRLPFYATQRFDPEICHLLNFVAPFIGEPYTYIDHPGTPVQIAGTVALAPFRLASRDSESFCLAVLQDPDRYLSVLHILTAILVAVGAFLLARHMVLRWRVPPLAAAAAAIAPFAFHPLAFPSLSLWSHNSLSYPLLPYALLFCADNLLRENGPVGWRTFVSGILFGILTAVQFYHVVWGAAALLGIACLLGSGSRRLSVAFSSCILATGAGLGFLVSTLPIAKNYSVFFGFIWRIASRTGHYGNGVVGVPTMTEWLANLNGLVSSLGAFPWALCLAATATSSLLLFPSKTRTAALWVLAAITVLAVAIVKHPQPIYTLALNSVLPVLLLLCICSSSAWAYRYLVGPAIVVVVVGVGVNFVFSIKRESSQLASFRDTVGKIQGIADAMVRKGAVEDDTLILYTYLVPQRANALRFGDSYSGAIFTRMIDRICPNDGFLKLGESEIRIPTGWPKQLSTATAYVAVCSRFRSMLPSIKRLTPCAQTDWDESQVVSGNILFFEIKAPLTNLPKPAGSIATLVNIDQSIAPIAAVDPRSSAPWWGLDGPYVWVGEQIEESITITIWSRKKVSATLSLDAKAGPGEDGIELMASLDAERVASHSLHEAGYSPTSFLLALKEGRNELRLSSSRTGRVQQQFGVRRRSLSVLVQNIWLELSPPLSPKRGSQVDLNQATTPVSSGTDSRMNSSRNCGI